MFVLWEKLGVADNNEELLTKLAVLWENLASKSLEFGVAYETPFHNPFLKIIFWIFDISNFEVLIEFLYFYIQTNLFVVLI